MLSLSLLLSLWLPLWLSLFSVVIVGLFFEAYRGCFWYLAMYLGTFGRRFGVPWGIGLAFWDLSFLGLAWGGPWASLGASQGSLGGVRRPKVA